MYGYRQHYQARNGERDSQGKREHSPPASAGTRSGGERLPVRGKRDGVGQAVAEQDKTEQHDDRVLQRNWTYAPQLKRVKEKQ